MSILNVIILSKFLSLLLAPQNVKLEKMNCSTFEFIFDPPEGFDNGTCESRLYYKNSRGKTSYPEGNMLMEMEIDLPEEIYLSLTCPICSRIYQKYTLDEIYKSKYRSVISHSFKIRKKK